MRDGNGGSRAAQRGSKFTVTVHVIVSVPRLRMCNSDKKKESHPHYTSLSYDLMPWASSCMQMVPGKASNSPSTRDTFVMPVSLR